MILITITMHSHFHMKCEFLKPITLNSSSLELVYVAKIFFLFILFLTFG